MWNVIRTLMYDAKIEHTGEFCDFVEFCYKEHDSECDLESRGNIRNRRCGMRNDSVISGKISGAQLMRMVFMKK